MIRVVHVIGDLDAGGAETALARLVASMDTTRFESTVISLTDLGVIGQHLRDIGMRVDTLDSGGAALPNAVVRLARRFRADRPDVVQTWMYRADIVGGIAARAAGVRAVAWGVRQSDLTAEGSGRRTVALARIAALLSGRIPAVTVFVAESAQRSHVRIGYHSDQTAIIPNGIPIPCNAPERAEARRILAVPPGGFVVTRVARYHPMKDPGTLIKAFGRLHGARPDAWLVCCGTGMNASNAELMRQVARAGVGASVRLLGHLDDPAVVRAASDVECSSSCAEGFPNAIGEAMAAGVPVVATDVGDTRELVDGAGFIVPARAPSELAEALGRMASLPEEERRRLGMVGRARVRDRFSLDAMTARYMTLYEELARVWH